MKLLFFTGEWCYACKKMKELLDRYNIKYEPVDVDKNVTLTREYDVNTLPTIIAIDEDGVPKDEFMGYSEKILDWYKNL